MDKHFTQHNVTTVSYAIRIMISTHIFIKTNLCSYISFFLVPKVYIFPGLGLGATLAGAKRVSDKMLYVAAEALATFVSDEDHKQGKVFPPLNQIRTVSKSVAIAVIKQAIEEGQASQLSAVDINDLDGFVQRKMYDPIYVPLVEKREISI